MWPVPVAFFDLIDSLFPRKVIPPFILMVLGFETQSQLLCCWLNQQSMFSSFWMMVNVEVIKCVFVYAPSWFPFPNSRNHSCVQKSILVFFWLLLLSTRPLLLTKLVIVISLIWLLFFNFHNLFSFYNIILLFDIVDFYSDSIDLFQFCNLRHFFFTMWI